MFTGIVEEIGKIQAIDTKSVVIECRTVLSDTKIGDSIAVNGVCLTVVKMGNNSFEANVSPETFKVSALGKLKSGALVNLERALPTNGRFGGHIVSGHVDEIGKIVSIKRNNDFYDLEIEIRNSKYAVKKGSITINGISLTIADINENNIHIAVIPHTYENTNLKSLKSGDSVNVEVDILAKYVEKFLSTRDNKSGVNMNLLLENGFC